MPNDAGAIHIISAPPIAPMPLNSVQNSAQRASGSSLAVVVGMPRRLQEVPISYGVGSGATVVSRAQPLLFRGVRPSLHQCLGYPPIPSPSKVGFSPPDGVIWAWRVVVTQLSAGEEVETQGDC